MDAKKKIDEVESWYRSKKYWVQVLGVFAFGFVLGAWWF